MFDAGESVKEVGIPIYNQSHDYGQVQFKVTLKSPPGGPKTGSPSEAEVVITFVAVGEWKRTSSVMCCDFIGRWLSVSSASFVPGVNQYVVLLFRNSCKHESSEGFYDYLPSCLTRPRKQRSDISIFESRCHCSPRLLTLRLPTVACQYWT